MSSIRGHQVIRACPSCASDLGRVQRRWIDRLISLYLPVHRYRCISPGCCWIGNLCARPLGDPGRTDGTSRRLVNKIADIGLS